MPLLGELCRAITYECHEGEGSYGPKSGPTDYPISTPTLSRQGGSQHGGPHTSTHAADTLGTFLEVLGLARVYLAGHGEAWSMALHFALEHPERLEGLVLIGAHEVAMDTRRGVMSLPARLHTMSVPTLVLLAEQVHAAFPEAEVLAERLPRCTKIIISPSPLAPSASVPALQLGHAMMRFLLHCERQRNLVRGASFLL
jgi:pimeloyl-ACP methyl ester carboxylesterase